jgi:hypothetical protein
MSERPPPGGELPESSVYWSSFAKPGQQLTQYSIGDLHAHLRLVELSRGLAWLGGMSATLWEQGEPVRWIENEAFSEWQFAFIAQELVRVGSDFGPLRLDEGSVAARAMDLANGLLDYFQVQRVGASAPERLNLARSFRYRTANEQYPSQAKRAYWIPRALSIFEHLARSERRAGEPDLNAEFEARYGLSVLEFVRIGFAVMTWITQVQPNFFTENLTGSQAAPLRGLLTGDRLGAFLRAASWTVDQFRAHVQAQGRAPKGLERYLVNPLLRRPIVRTPLGYVVPSIWMLVQRLTSGIYFDFHEPRAGNTAEIKGYGALVGRLFEAHVGQELACYFAEGELFPERKYQVGREEWRSPDFTIVEGASATLVECKTSRVTKQEREQARIPTIRKRLNQEIIPAIHRLQVKAEHIRQRHRGLDAWPKLDEFEFVIVTLDPWWPESLMRELIHEALAGPLSRAFATT